jgi:hypothetical protein
MLADHDLVVSSKLRNNTVMGILYMGLISKHVPVHDYTLTN